MSECQSTRGEWGGVCPDCGRRLPARQPRMASWMAERHNEGYAIGGRRAASIFNSRRRRTGWLEPEW